ncbi:hypothetical protein [Nocardia bovistercoris]|uniref:Uncharacterized protein n=1 Tax=Nocardia bovistercoris TaxID=2785916 RepID=A0A931N693_9NOCA|nr:hypothetical protein [Nocardia bovistercoris]MBH0779453.1 hypothetical protein [Nocardia bovistercoris]
MDDADRAQARVFLQLLSMQARTLSREIALTGTGSSATRRLETELQDVRRYIDRLQHRFPDAVAPR